MTSPVTASHAQTALWLAGRILPDASAHNLLWSLTLRGPLDVARLSAALTAVVRRQESLRAVPEWTGERLALRIAAPQSVKLRAEALAEPLESFATRFGMAPYDLEAGPLCRFHLVAEDAETHVLLCGFHHLLIDGTSWPVFVDDLLAALGGNALPDPAQGYADHCRWQHGPAEPEGWDAARAHWRRIGAALPSAWEMQLEGESGEEERGAALHRLALPDALADRLRQRAEEWQTGPFRIAFAAWIALLHLETRREQLPVATTYAGRRRGDWPGVVGLFASSGIVQAELTPETDFRALAGQVAAQIAEGVAHQDFPSCLAHQDAAAAGRQMLEALPVSFSRQPGGRSQSCGALEVRDARVFLPCTDHDLAGHFLDEDGSFVLQLVYRSAKFRPAAIARLVRRYVVLLAHALERPETAVGALDRLPPEDRDCILGAWNQNDRSFDLRPLHELVEAQAARTPHRVALVGPEGALSYRQVNGAANALAHRLIAEGIGPGRVVPLLMESSVEMLIAELAVMKAGAAFAPLDPHWPQARVERILTRLDARLVLVAGAEEAALAGPDRLSLRVAVREDGAENPRVASALDDAVYCIFTSGSTGEPKGALNAHRGVANRLLAMTEAFGSPIEDRILATASAMADTHVWQYFWPLIGGGRVVIMPRVQVTSPARIVALMQAEAITFTDFIPSIFQPLVAHLAAHQESRPACSGLRWVLLGGEAMNAADTRGFQRILPHVGICNTYGPTETSIGVLFHKLPLPFVEPIPIGRPLPNVRAVILDAEGRLAPVGTVGELCIGGAAVGLGYLGNPAATAERFIANPFPELGCDRLYRTGDLARFRPDGLIEYLGREDHQIKIRGARIEPGEVEAALMRHPTVAQALVARDEGGTMLVAHLVPAGGAVLDAAALREALRAELPVHMIPGRFVELASLPLTPAGKTDRKALSRLSGMALPNSPEHVAPRSPLERQLVAIWQGVLRREGVGVHDNFFADLGGESLKALLLVAALQEAGLGGDIRLLYETQTVAGLAVRLSGAERPDGQRARGGAIIDRQRPYLATWSGERVSPDGLLFTRNAGGPKPPLFWCFQGAVEFQQLAAHLGPEQPLIGMRSGHLIMDYDDVSLDAIAARYVQEMLALQPQGAFRLGGNCQGGRIAHRIAAHLARRGREVALLIQMEETIFAPHSGRVALIYGKISKLNPFIDGDPTPLLQERYSGGYSVDIVPGAHGEFFQDRHVPALARAVAARLAEPPLARDEAA